MDKQRLIYLIRKRQHDRCSAAENAELYELMHNPGIEKEILLLWDELQKEKNIEVSTEDSERLYNQILSNPEIAAAIQDKSANIAKSRWPLTRQKIVAAAAVLAIFMSVYFIIFHSDTEQKKDFSYSSTSGTEVLPGSNKARIVFENGTYQELGDHLGAADTDETSLYTIDGKNGRLSYLESSDTTKGPTTVHTLITPRGGEYAIQLADGTKVWLNANSTLKYPVSFHHAHVREVELEGEAYFDVANARVNGKHVPFVVKSKGQALEVLGTEFNINTFKNKITTTLIEGSVKVAFDNKSTDQSLVLKPNDQLVYDNQSEEISVAQIDPYYVTAWKSGDFAFDNAPLENVMEDIARWYDISIEYKSEIDDVKFSGKVSRFENIETLLQTIEWTGSVKLTLNGRRITVMK